MRAKIIDEFTDLPVSRQRKCQLRHNKSGLCMTCGKPSVFGGRCLKHDKANSARVRKHQGSKAIYKNTKLRRYMRAANSEVRHGGA